MSLKLASKNIINAGCEIAFDLMEEQYCILSFVQELLLLKKFKSNPGFSGLIVYSECLKIPKYLSQWKHLKRG